MRFPEPVLRLAEELQDDWTFHDHALQRMEERDISYEDIAKALWDFDVFEYSRWKDSVDLNLWGHDGRGRRLRITLVPELRVISTVALFHQWNVGDYIKLKMKHST